MPLIMMRQLITEISCDAIVNPTNPALEPTGGLDAAIHAAAGPSLYEACRSLLPLAVGDAKVTAAFSLPCRYVIHTAGPLWRGGAYGEEEALVSCYRNALMRAKELSLESIAFPLIASGTLGFPKERVMKLAHETIGAFLEDYEMTVYLVVFDKSEYAISRELFEGVQSYLDEGRTEMMRMASLQMDMAPMKRRRRREHMADISVCARQEACFDALPPDAIDDILKHLDKGFADTLFAYIDEKGITDVECYKRSNVDKKTFSKIKCNPDYRPGKVTAVSFAIGLHLTLDETYHLLETVGLTLSKSIAFDAIILYFITTGNYKTIHDVNEVLYHFDQATLGC